MLCGEGGSVDIGEFLDEEIKGPATFVTTQTAKSSKSTFQEPNMNNLISQVFGDDYITLECDAGECLYHTEVPGYEKPIPAINTPLIAGVIGGSALVLVALILGIWYLSRRAFDRHGPIYLDDSDDESAKMMTDHKPAALQFRDVSYQINGKQILSGVRGTIQPGQVMAIIGSSGAGKSTFLDILARKNKRGIVTGNFYVNGEQVSDADFKSIIGFVDQEDAMMPTLTVHETILNSALLRLPRDMGRNVKEAKVYEVERQLGIAHIRDQLIGSEESGSRGISGGEKRRVGIACELVTSPSILFLDEPTSGLDSHNAYNVVECLVNLARSYNRTVIFTIHQPRSNIVALFDQLVLLTKGRTVYSGPFAKCQAYFDSLGYSCPPGFNIADYLVDLTMHAANETLSNGGLDIINQQHERPPTIGSSVRAIKSIRSSQSIDNSTYGSPSESSKRPIIGRRQSIKQQQDRKLFTRKQSHATGTETPETAQTDDEGPNLSNTLEASQQWLRLSRHHGGVPPQILDDPHQLPPPAPGLGEDLDLLITSYYESDVAKAIEEEIDSAVQTATAANGASNGLSGATKSNGISAYKRPTFFQQFKILSKRTWTNLYRNPMLMLAHYAIAVLVSVLCGFCFYSLDNGISGFQDRLGLLFFILALFGFSTLTSITVFSSERLIFLRERSNGYYSPITYFASKVFFDIVPLRLLPPLLVIVVVYPMTGLKPAWPEFWTCALTLVLFNLAAAAICLLIGIIFRENAVANLVGSLVMLFSILFAGFLLNSDTIPPQVKWLQDVSFSFGVFAFIETDQLHSFLYSIMALKHFSLMKYVISDSSNTNMVLILKCPELLFLVLSASKSVLSG
jgi:ABC-type multidrug transport system ATPase subunit